MNSRISLVLKAKNITPAQLADEIGVQRSGISHILNGRNKPSLEFIQKLLKRYPDISMPWLLLGEGPMMVPFNVPESDMIDQTKKISENVLPIDLFSGTAEPEPEISNPQVVNLPDSVNNLSENQSNENTRQESQIVHEKNLIAENVLLKESKPTAPSIPLIERNEKATITRIVIFYDDRTFVEYTPGKE